MGHSFYNKDYYELFDVSKDASSLDIKYAYTRLIKQYSNETHPEEFMHIRKGYKMLTDSAQKREYDDYLNHHINDTTDEYNPNHRREHENTLDDELNNQSSKVEEEKDEYNIYMNIAFILGIAMIFLRDLGWMSLVVASMVIAYTHYYRVPTNRVMKLGGLTFIIILFIFISFFY